MNKTWWSLTQFLSKFESVNKTLWSLTQLLSVCTQWMNQWIYQVFRLQYPLPAICVFAQNSFIFEKGVPVQLHTLLPSQKDVDQDGVEETVISIFKTITPNRHTYTSKLKTEHYTEIDQWHLEIYFIWYRCKFFSRSDSCTFFSRYRDSKILKELYFFF